MTGGCDSCKTEEKIAALLGGQRRGGSGSKYYAKGDVITEWGLIEVKQTRRKSYAVSLRVLDKISREALGVAKEPALAVVFENAPRWLDKEWVMMPVRVLRQLVEQGPVQKQKKGGSNGISK